MMVTESLLSIWVSEGEKPLDGDLFFYDRQLEGRLTKLIQQGLFHGRMLEQSVFPAAYMVDAAVVQILGIGSRESLTTEQLFELQKSAMKTAVAHGLKHVKIVGYMSMLSKVELHALMAA